MRMSGISVTPEWVEELMCRHAPPEWRCVLFLPKTGRPHSWTHGWADMGSHRIEIAVSAEEKGDDSLWAVLHELAHAIHDSQYPGGYYTRIKRVNGRRPRNSLHPPEFWQIAHQLYQQYPGVLKYAIGREYMIGRKLLEKMIVQ